MIFYSAELPYLRVGEQFLLHLRLEWLDCELQKAAQMANIPTPWWPSKHIVDGIALWLQHPETPAHISLQELESRILQALHGIGMKEVADNLCLSLPPLQVELTQFCSSTDHLSELHFFHALGEHLNYLRSCGFSSFAFTGLNESVHTLCPARKHSKHWHKLHSEIEAFLHLRVGKNSKEPLAR